MRSILRQLSSSMASLPIREPIVRAYQRRREEGDGCDAPELSLAESLELTLALMETNPATIVIDGLDACDSARRWELLHALDEIIRGSANLVKVFVSSRDDYDIAQRFASSPNVLIRESDNCRDIEAFVHSEVNQVIRTRRLLSGNVSDHLKRQIVDTLIGGAGGM
jgi:hypothetical protein